jgi:hypothetical protein
MTLLLCRMSQRTNTPGTVHRLSGGPLRPRPVSR